MVSISIIIPAHNEEKRIGRTLDEYLYFFKDIKELKQIDDFEILVVLNACKDKTREVIESYMKKRKEIRILEFEQGGKGFAIKKGFEEALKRKAELIGFVDADMSTPPYAFYDLIKNIKNYDGVIASRWIKGSIVKPKQSLKRRIVSRVGNFIIRSLFLFSYRDTQCGAKIFRRGALEKILPSLWITQWAFDIDLLYQAKKHKIKVKEVPTIWIDRERSKLNLGKASIQVFFSVVQLRMANSFLKRSLKMFKPIINFIWKKLK